ncbi:GNAT family N-acetyltransferase [Pseudanabaena sp. FACHB-2040]|uniref:GNAT family N-acetyltransferase n=1 Tax=Pseudanabaena sp. FACHB-2040 TaxID=2692859 RepID=UPI0016861738|nr:GNAT family N-acetyltransferase [Pseudanabaena sp. FACHB-2040]MBD2259224.1 GNAT family N-acetyltransferase [Pseudanabaena sp. FACHB-2040]
MTSSNAESSSLPESSLQMRVRSARLEDLPQLTEILTSSFYVRTGWMGWLYPLLKLGISEDLRQRLRSQNPHYACLAVIRQILPVQMATHTYCDCVTGTIELSQRYALPWQPIKPQHLYISNLAVHSEFRRQGVAQLLLKTCESIALEWGFDDLYLHVMEDNLQARQLYRKAGFHLVQSKSSGLPWLRPYPRRLLMHKPLVVNGQ